MTARKLRLDFAAVIARSHTPANHAEAMRSLQTGAPSSVKEYFAIGENGSFDLDTVSIVTRAA